MSVNDNEKIEEKVYQFRKRLIFDRISDIENVWRSEGDKKLYAELINNEFNELSNNSQKRLIIDMSERFDCLQHPNELEGYWKHYGIISEIIKPFCDVYLEKINNQKYNSAQKNIFSLINFLIDDKKGNLFYDKEQQYKKELDYGNRLSIGDSINKSFNSLPDFLQDKLINELSLKTFNKNEIEHLKLCKVESVILKPLESILEVIEKVDNSITLEL